MEKNKRINFFYKKRKGVGEEMNGWLAWLARQPGSKPASQPASQPARQGARQPGSEAAALEAPP